MIIQLDKDKEGVLRTKARPVTDAEISDGTAARIAQHMSKDLAEHDDGLALAAPQIGELVRIFILSKLMLSKEKEDLVLINPIITRKSKKMETAEEGCLSIRGTYGLVSRSIKISMNALSLKGDKLNIDASGLLARAIQHEIDHLDGILFTDKAKDVYLKKEEQLQ